MLPVHNFTYGLLTPGLAFLMSCLGAFLGLRCTTRARSFEGWARTRWLLYGGVAIGAIGIWTMHFIAMLGFTVPGQTIRYNVPVTILSLLVAVGIVCAGLLIAGSGELRIGSLLAGGVITGLGVAVMHYLGMAAMRMSVKITYDPGLFILSIVIAIIAATAALWCALRLNSIGVTMGAAVIMGIAVSGMHYTGMAAMRVSTSSGPSGMVMGGGGGSTAESFLLPLIIGITIVSFMMTAGITLTPDADEIRYDAALLDQIDGVRATQPIRAIEGDRPPDTRRPDEARSARNGSRRAGGRRGAPGSRRTQDADGSSGYPGYQDQEYPGYQGYPGYQEQEYPGYTGPVEPRS
jgi:NO-binding membrane sensor protein with MHYT domain